MISLLRTLFASPFSGLSLLLIVIFPSLTGNCVAEQWPNLRGPHFNGAAFEKSIPTWISKQAHVNWKTELSGTGSSTPIVWTNSIFATALNKEQTGLNIYKINLWKGNIEWTQPFSECKRRDRRSDMAGPSPTTDGKTVVFMSGNGDLAAFDYEGNELWRRNLQEDYGKFSLKWTYSSSPILHNKTLYIQILQRSESIDGIVPGRPSLLLALDPKTGEEKFKHIRNTRAVGESQEAYSSPIPIEFKGRKEILIAGADGITSHHPLTGKETWRWGTWNREREPDWRTVSSPVLANNMVIACAPKGRPVFAFDAGQSGTININDVMWKSRESDFSCDITSPLYFNGLVYFLNGRKKIMTCVEPMSGAIRWTGAIPARAKIEASPSGADGKIFVMSHTGEVFVIKATGDEFKIIHSTVLGEDPDAKNRATIVPAMGRLIIRVGTHLWCMD